MKPKVGLLDPNLSSLNFIKNIFADFDCHIFTHPEEVLTKLEKEPFDLLVSEWELPSLPGEDFCKKIAEKHPNLPLIFLSGVREPEIKIKALKAGAIDFVTKPFDREFLLAKLQAILKLTQNLNYQNSGEPKQPQHYILPELAQEYGFNMVLNKSFEQFLDRDKTQEKLMPAAFCILQIRFLNIPTQAENNATIKKINHTLLILKKIVHSNAAVFFHPPNILSVKLSVLSLQEAEEKKKRFQYYLTQFDLSPLVSVQLLKEELDVALGFLEKDSVLEEELP